ncbi:MAG: Gfo/Idh/MocA family oxidoreductase, partial [Rubripirellula sp.]
RMSCSYGPGRYDPEYEDKGRDYPAAYVRWTEKRNMESFQEMVHSGRLELGFLTTHRFALEEAAKAYDMILNRSEPFLGILLQYDTSSPIDRRPILRVPQLKQESDLGVSFVGAGSYAQGNLLPNLPASVERRSVLTNSGTTSRRVVDKFKFSQSVSVLSDILDDEKTNVVFVATRHDTHGKYVTSSIGAGKHVFVEKPVCLYADELDEITRLLVSGRDEAPQLMVGYNRRFSPHSARLKDALNDGPKTIVYRVNAGTIPSDKWIQDREVGGGRILGEVCHFVDYISWVCDCLPVRVYARALPDASHHDDAVSIALEMSDGSVGTVHYFSNGGAGLPKEYVEVHQSGNSVVVNDFRETRVFGRGKPQVHKTRSQDKGQADMIRQFFASLKAAKRLLPVEQMYSVMDACFAAQKSLVTHESIDVRQVRSLASPGDSFAQSGNRVTDQKTKCENETINE